MEVRRITKKKVRVYKKKEALKEIDTLLTKLPEAEKGTAQKLIREDRDNH
ncbi:MAG: hypothetical protein J7L47_01205 [Candidatus Odinarchaeota archaeon]|nr:hypothetical protein [Candidatus Odinarchaeota archaeon]